MNDEPCMCGTQADCWADNHLMPIDQAANYLGISKSAVLVAVHRGKLRSVTKDDRGHHIFDLANLAKYAATRRIRSVAQRQRSDVRSARP